MVHTLCMFRDLCVRMDVYSHSECAASMRALIMKHSVCVCVYIYIYIQMGNQSIEALRANWSAHLAWDDALEQREDERDTEEDALQHDLLNIDALIDEYKTQQEEAVAAAQKAAEEAAAAAAEEAAAAAAEKASWLDCLTLGGLKGEYNTKDSGMKQVCCHAACTRCGRDDVYQYREEDRRHSILCIENTKFSPCK